MWENAQHGFGKEFEFPGFLLFLKLRFGVFLKRLQLIDKVVLVKIDLHRAFFKELVQASAEYHAIGIEIIKYLLE